MHEGEQRPTLPEARKSRPKDLGTGLGGDERLSSYQQKYVHIHPAGAEHGLTVERGAGSPLQRCLLIFVAQLQLKARPQPSPCCATTCKPERVVSP